MGQRSTPGLSDQDLKVIHQLSPLWQPIQSRWWRNPLDYRLELLSQPQASPIETAAETPASCAIQDCRYALYRPGFHEVFAYCMSHRDATQLVITDALARHQQQQMAIAG